MNDLKSILQKFKLKRGGSPFGWGASPDADWKVIFLSTLALIVLVSVWSFLEFIKVSKGEVSIVEDDGVVTTALFDLNNLKDTAAYYEAKALEFERIKNGTSTSVVDPSI